MKCLSTPFLFVSVSSVALLVEGCSDTRGWIIGERPNSEFGGAGPSADGGNASSGSSTGSGDGGQGGDSGDGGTGGGSSFWESACSPTVSFENLDPTDQGVRAETTVGAPTLFVHDAAHAVCGVLYRDATEVPVVPSVHLVLEDFDGVGTVSAGEIRISSRYLSDFELGGGDSSREARGMARFLLAHVNGHPGEGAPGWVISGKADYVRLASGYLDEAGATPGGAWTDGFRTTAYFFAHLTMTDPDFVYELNQRMAPGQPPYGDALFEQLLGSDISALWGAYQGSF